VSGVLDALGHGLSNAFSMAWQVWWALVLGFAVSAVVQAWVPRERIERSLGSSGPRSLAIATGFGAASSSCSYAAVAIARSLFEKGASASSALAFQFASTNLVTELGVVIWVLIGWQFALAELFGGLVLVVVMALALRLFVSAALEQRARAHAQAAATGHRHNAAASALPLAQRLRSIEAWSDVAHNFRNDWAMLWKEILAGFVLAGFIGLLGNGFLGTLFVRHAPAGVRLVENTLVGPLIAMATFVCSVGNVPVAAVLWSGGIGFGGVIAFIFADLIVLPIVAVYRKYYGTAFALRITALMFATIVVAALIVDGVFSGLGLVGHARPTRAEVFAPVGLGYRALANALALGVFAALFAITLRRGARDPVCGMKVDRSRALTLRSGARTLHFCSEDCRQAYEGRRAGEAVSSVRTR
jgi:hypothetical protein